MSTKTAGGGDPLTVVSALVEAGGVDTVYRDVYLDRAGTLLGPVLTVEDFERVDQLRLQLARLPLEVGRAVESGNWPLVKELTGRIQTLRDTTEQKGHALAVARDVYAVTDIKLDPFSPGLQQLAQVSPSGLAALRNGAIERLATLERGDTAWRDFYARRRAAFENLVVTDATSEASGSTDRRDPRTVAAAALKSGDMAGLRKLADVMIDAAGRSPAGPARPTTAPSAPSAPSTDLLVDHSAETLERAARLGLARRRLAPRTELAYLREYAWNPLFSDGGGRIEIQRVPLPAGTPEAFRERLEMSMVHPIVNSGGARHLPTLVAEDVLVEDFPEVGEDEQPAGSELLALLGFPTRRGLSRIAIEQAFLARGARVLDSLRLDPRPFRLVCIPPDVHLRLGEAEGWGRQPLWTHFDGYLVMADGRKRALAGGHAKFGGLYNLMGVGRDYDSDRLCARFAVVRRDRMVAW
jgi:hypothetical protein